MPSQLRVEALYGAGREGGHVVEMQRRRLLLAFADVLAEHGLEDAGVGRVCKRAGVSRRTFYELFDDREACFAALLGDVVERISHGVLPADTGKLRWREHMRAGLTALLEFFDAEPALAQVCLVETLKAGPAVIERRRQMLDVLIAAVDRGRGETRGENGPPPLTADSTVGGALSVIHARVIEDDPRPLVELTNPLMSMIVHPYLGPAAARRELEWPVSQAASVRNGPAPPRIQDPFEGLPIRITFRTARVLATIATRPGASNREVADTAGVSDQGQISKLLRRLADYGLIENHGQGHPKGEPNAWRLTERGQAIQHVIELPAT
jgi:AcrR family transcriptional regulator